MVRENLNKGKRRHDRHQVQAMGSSVDWPELHNLMRSTQAPDQISPAGKKRSPAWVRAQSYRRATLGI